MHKIVASDMDETFLDHTHAVPQANVDAVRELRERGVLFVPASGRAYGSILASLSPIRDLLEGSYVISYNGGCIHRVGEKSPLAQSELSRSDAERLLALGRAAGFGAHAYTMDGTCWGWGLVEAERRYLRGHMEICDAPEEGMAFLGDTKVAKVLFVDPDGLARLRGLLERMRAADAGLLSRTEWTFSSNRYLEFNPAGVNKGHGLRRLAAALGIDMADTVAVGDSANDLAMIEAAGLGAAVANATPEVAAAADVRLDATCDDGAIAEVAHMLAHE